MEIIKQAHKTAYMTLYERQKGGFCVPERWKQ